MSDLFSPPQQVALRLDRVLRHATTDQVLRVLQDAPRPTTTYVGVCSRYVDEATVEAMIADNVDELGSVAVLRALRDVERLTYDGGSDSLSDSGSESGSPCDHMGQSGDRGSRGEGMPLLLAETLETFGGAQIAEMIEEYDDSGDFESYCLTHDLPFYLYGCTVGRTLADAFVARLRTRKTAPDRDSVCVGDRESVAAVLPSDRGGGCSFAMARRVLDLLGVDERDARIWRFDRGLDGAALIAEHDEDTDVLSLRSF